MNAAERLYEWLTATKEKGSYVDVEIAGRVFGARNGEAMPRPHDYSYQDSTLVICFEGTQTLIVLRPSGVEVGRYGELIIPDAEVVRWGWHYHGRPATPENWCTKIYHFVDGVVTCTIAGPTVRDVAQESFQREGAPAVRLV